MDQAPGGGGGGVCHFPVKKHVSSTTKEFSGFSDFSCEKDYFCGRFGTDLFKKKAKIYQAVLEKIMSPT